MNPPEVKSQGTISKFRKKKKFCRCLFTLSLKHEIRHFDVSVVQRRQRNVQKKCAARSILLFCSLNLLLLLFVCFFFLTFSLPFVSLDLELDRQLIVEKNQDCSSLHETMLQNELIGSNLEGQNRNEEEEEEEKENNKTEVEEGTGKQQK